MGPLKLQQFPSQNAAQLLEIVVGTFHGRSEEWQAAQQRLDTAATVAAAACEFLVNHPQLFLRTGWVVSSSLPGYNYCCVWSDLECHSRSPHSPLSLIIKQNSKWNLNQLFFFFFFFINVKHVAK